VQRGDGAALLEVFPALGVYNLDSPCPALPNACSLLGSARTLATSDKAVSALFTIVAAEQRGRPADAVTAMAAANGSPLAEHPALLASFALALEKGGAQTAQAARAAGLPSDPSALKRRALKAQPYNPLYWSDTADGYGLAFAWPTAMTLYEVAEHLPVPGARHRVLQSKTQTLPPWGFTDKLPTWSRPMLSLAAAVTVFVLIHLIVSGTRVRDGLVASIGEGRTWACSR
jgi:hypothetical protein